MHCPRGAAVLFNIVITHHVLGLLKDGKLISVWKWSSVAFLEVFIFIVPLMLLLCVLTTVFLLGLVVKPASINI
jgi:hypothetical protein